MAKKFWLVKSEPHKYSWEQFNKDGQTFWDGVRNYQARNNLRDMQKNDLVLFYHSNEGLAVVGIAKVINTAYKDPTIDDERWLAVDLAPVMPLHNHVTLAEMKQTPGLEHLALIKQSRLSVCPVSKAAFDIIVKLGGVNPSSIK
jgi:predicted RNA-binding protein with PUA-like domain